MLTQPMHDMAVRLWQEEGLSAARVAQALAVAFPDYAGPLTRNVIIGLSHRGSLGKVREKKINQYVNSLRKERRATRMGAQKPHRPRKLKWSGSPKMVPGQQQISKFGSILAGPSHEGVDPGIEDKVGAFECVTTTAPKSLIDLEPGECRWPIGDPKGHARDTMFCGAKCRHKLPYCDAHYVRS